MTNQLFKNGVLPFVVDAYDQSVYDSKIVFSTQDIGTAKLVFQLRKDGVPLPLSAVDGKLVLSFNTGSKNVRNITLVDKVEGIAEYVLDNDEIKQYGKVQASLNLYYRNGQALSIHEFTFDIQRNLIDQDIAPAAEFYIDDFQSLKKQIEDLYDNAIATIAELEEKFEDLDNVETKDGAQAKVSAHESKTSIHVTESDKEKWNESQIYKITADDGKHLIAVPSGGSIFDAIKGKGTCTFYAPSGIVDSPAPSNSALRGIQTVGQSNIGTGFAVDTSGNAYYFYYNSGHTSITWAQLPTTADKNKWNGAQLAKLTLDNGRVFYKGSTEVTDYNTITQTGMYLIYNAGLNGPPSFNRVFLLVMSYGNTLTQVAYESATGKQAYFRFRKVDSETWTAWERQLTATDLDVTWQKPTLQPSWKQYAPADGSIHTVRFSKDAAGVVEIKGAVYGGVLGLDTPVFTLPAGYRPMQSEYFIGVASSIGTPGAPQYHRTFIGTDGRVCIQSSSNTSNPVEFLSFGFRFRTR
ncbi:BppU family phage baseplate upper protein [Bacillus altitudinis]|uniref:BppU family phage baseplate upper protein n=1 Tax=Bacillus altitudinis TaxID=293387 RepID=UPI0015688C00|nr:BppU family phage baseplate upper protein [Bacillus altitudinis]QKJ41699.1 BppU family phage baseplate upper protein [Bacillus altitudinis]